MTVNDTFYTNQINYDVINISVKIVKGEKRSVILCIH